MSLYTFYQEDRIRIAKELKEIADNFTQKGWLPATAGNLSIKLSSDPLVFGVTASGKDKEQLQLEDILAVDKDCKPIEPTRLRPSAETIIHSRIYQETDAGSVLHVHTVYNNLLSEIYFAEGRVTLSHMELIKGLDIWEEGATIEIPVIENYADIPKLADEIGRRLDPRVPGVLIRKHGIYAWGKTPFEAKRHVEALEFMFHYQFMWLSIARSGLVPQQAPFIAAAV
ncbi:methylthioribulose 1-phosphate dehydratase [Effusibacillus lacus]|uniref:Methylthioribulose-1-phosphate dehydratase n=1 Tax=Effusibacillus lacus TaxID=1348429 RepID=A0A292YJD4_9BACL|nr:methylthioribulose 1-phosphate dehydratase [Effusibacillus lacus]TCS74779.1 methylthioribulose-1-phosphate dehydratase [Effusibacillus lacus]GAX88590.1 methylthioribulose-1-phosphate dehydratase [Effusibacillus lacus]